MEIGSSEPNPHLQELHPPPDIDSDNSNGSNVNSDSDVDEPPPTNSILAKLRADPPPDALPEGWNMHRSHSQHGYVYYFNQFTGKCQWEAPFAATVVPPDSASGSASNRLTAPKLTTGLTAELDLLIGLNPKPILKRGPTTQTEIGGKSENINTTTSSPPPPKNKKSRLTNTTPTPERKSNEPEKVRVLHILKKHSKSRNPSSWRNRDITLTRNDAVAELEEVRSILAEVAEGNDAKELRATFEELARTESDCSSARKMGDMGYFGRKKMKPNFEKVSFGLRVGELSGIVDTSSGVHIILRLG